jgi:hypothetical protein
VSFIFPLGTAYLPGDVVVLNVFEERYVQMFSDMVGTTDTFASVLISRGSEVGGNDSRHDFGVEITVDGIDNSDSGLVVRGRATSVCEVKNWLPDNPYPQGECVNLAEDPVNERHRFDIATSLSLLAQNVRKCMSRLADNGIVPTSRAQDRPSLTEIAAGRWWDSSVSDDELWSTFWTVARSVPCGALDRYSFLVPAPLEARTRLLRLVIDHVNEVISFRLDT